MMDNGGQWSGVSSMIANRVTGHNRRGGTSTSNTRVNTPATNAIWVLLASQGGYIGVGAATNGDD